MTLTNPYNKKVYSLLVINNNNIIDTLEPTKIYSPEEQRERALKALRLNGDTSPDYDPRLLAGSSIKKKPTVRIKLLLHHQL
jgi:hypothetical protein